MSFVELVKEMVIEIPKIQRDYAQGRQTGRIEEIRYNFLDSLISYLDDGTWNHDLDFIYGSTPKGLSYSGNFIPLDGQQRLTTLFLLHWYIAAINGKSELFRTLLYRETSSCTPCRFTYQTRESSMMFCEGLTKCDINPAESIKDLPTCIRNEYWYFSSWNYDPSITGMINMLEAIHNKIGGLSEEVFTKYYNRLFGTVDDEGTTLYAITFQLLNIGDFHLTDDLYIKMNSRGVPLTDFEIFKSKIEQLLYKKDFLSPETIKTFTVIERGTEAIKSLPLGSYFSYKMDRNWTNTFWHFVKDDEFIDAKSIDKKFMRFMRFAFACSYSTQIFNINNTRLTRKPYRGDIDPIEILLQSRKARRQFSENAIENLSFYQLKECNVFTSGSMLFLIDALDVLEKANPVNTCFEFDERIFPFTDIWDNLMDSEHFYNLDNISFIKLFAYISYLIKLQRENRNFDTCNVKEDINRWMRFVHNVTVRETTRLDDSDLVARAIWSIENILSKTTDSVYNRISQFSDSECSLYVFDTEQITEERLKAYLILNSGSNWEKAITEAENHPYLNGQIGFLLEYADAYDLYGKDIVPMDDSNVLNTFGIYKSKTEILFTSMLKSIEEEIYTTPEEPFENEALIEHALLCCDDYLPEIYPDWYTLSNKYKDRDFSWRRLVSMDKKRTHCRDTFKMLLDKLVLNCIDNVTDELRNLINSRETFSAEDKWKESVINTPQISRYCNNGFMVFDGDSKDGWTGIYLISKSRWNSYHAELFTFELYHYLLPTFDMEDQLTYKYAASYQENGDIRCDIWKDMTDENNDSWYSINYDYDDDKYHITYYPNNDEDVEPEGDEIILKTKKEVRDYLKSNCK